MLLTCATISETSSNISTLVSWSDPNGCLKFEPSREPIVNIFQFHQRRKINIKNIKAESEKKTKQIEDCLNWTKLNMILFTSKIWIKKCIRKKWQKKSFKKKFGSLFGKSYSTIYMREETDSSRKIISHIFRVFSWFVGYKRQEMADWWRIDA